MTGSAATILEDLWKRVGRFESPTARARTVLPFGVKEIDGRLPGGGLAAGVETGFRHTETGEVVPRNIITSFNCRYNGVEVFRADLLELFLMSRAGGMPIETPAVRP